jgi:hypothetical protein
MLMMLVVAPARPAASLPALPVFLPLVQLAAIVDVARAAPTNHLSWWTLLFLGIFRSFI